MWTIQSNSDYALRLKRTRRICERDSINFYPQRLSRKQQRRIESRMFLFQASNPDVNFAMIAPELIVGVAAVVVTLVDAFTRRSQSSITAALSISDLLAAAAV